MDNNRKRKVVIIGLDGASLDLIKPWAEEGFLPNFKEILRYGAYGKLRTVIPPLTASAWSTLYTGKNLGKHGLFDFVALRPNSYDIVPTSFADNKAQTFWEIAGSFGGKCVILNTPFTYPVKKINGILVSGLQTPPQVDDFIYPPELRKEMDEIAERYKIYPIEFENNPEAYLQSLLEVTEKQFKIFFHYFKEIDWNLFMCVNQGIDFIQHHFWHYMDSNHPCYREDNKYKKVIRRYYQKIDAYLLQFIRSLDEETILIVVSDHGVSPLHKFIFVNNWLHKWGMIKFKQNPTVWIKKICFALNFSLQDIYNFLFHRRFGSEQKKKVRYFFSFRDIDWKKTKAFSFTNNGQIFLNVKGRQPYGNVAPGKEYEQVCDEIIAQLYRIKDLKTGEQVIEGAYKRDQLYSGECISSIPDIFLLSNQGKYMNKGGNKFYSNKLIEDCSEEDVSAGHSLDGIALFYGNGVSRRKELQGLHIQDIAPIILTILGLDIPQDMDGKIKEEIFRSGFLKNLKYSSIKVDKNRESFNYNQSDINGIEKQLKELGYID